MTENFIAIGDIHGSFSILCDLLEKIAASPYKDFQLVFLGDMVDRGPQSFGVVNKIKELTENGKAMALLGNHEDMMLDYCDGAHSDLNHIWFYNGGVKTMKSYAESSPEFRIMHFPKVIAKTGHYRWLRELPLYFETDKVWFSHAPVPQDKFLDRLPSAWNALDFRKSRHILTWGIFHDDLGLKEGEEARDHGKLAVCGHIHAVRQRIFTPRRHGNTVYADTGCGCWPSAPLSGVVIENGEWIDTIQAFPPNPVFPKEQI